MKRTLSLLVSVPLALPLAARAQPPLTVEAAVASARARNAAYRAHKEEAAAAAAEAVQAAKLKNPTLHGSLRYPDRGGGAVGRELGLSMDLLDLFERPLRRDAAGARAELAQAALAQEERRLAAETQAAYYAYQGALQRLSSESDALASLDAAARMAERQREAGNLSALDLAAHRAAYHEAKARLAGQQADAAAARERLAVLVGLANQDWSVEPRLPGLPDSDPDAAALEAAALARRMDLQAARRAPEAADLDRRIENLRGWSSPEVGLDSEKEYDGTNGYGPFFEAELPLFDRRQGSKARLAAEVRRARAEAESLEAQVRREVREAAARLAAARTAATEYGSAVVPLTRQVLEETQKSYNFMLTGVYQLLEAKRRSLEAETALAGALEDYWTRRAELELAAGGLQ